MEWQNSIPTHFLKQRGQVILLEAEPGQSRRGRIQQWLEEIQSNGVATWFLSCDREEGGPWAGVNDLLSNLVPQIQIHAPELITKHDYELVHVLPILRRTISVRHFALTETAQEEDRVRYYPADRAFRILHGLIDLVAAWHQRSNHSAWVIVCDHIDHSGALVRRFFVELMRRRGEQMNLTLLIATDIGASETVAREFNLNHLGQCVKLNEIQEPTPPLCKQEMARLAQELAQQVGEDEIELENHLPQLIRYWLLSHQPEKALTYQIRACSIYTRQGFYEDGLVYGEAALAQLEQQYPEDILKRSQLVEKMYLCCIALNYSVRVLQLLQDVIEKTIDRYFLSRSCYMIAMLYTRYLPNRDLAKAEAYLEQGLKELAQADLPKHAKLFRITLNRNGLALIRQRQGKSQEAIQLCLSSYEQLNYHLDPHRHCLQRSILLYNIAQVYAAICSYDEAISYFTATIAIDPYYSEYHNERGNVYFKMGRLDDALNDYLKAIELSPPYPEVWTNLAQCYRLMGQMAQAIDAYSSSLDLDANQSLALVGRAQAFELLEQPDAALVDYSAAIALNPNQPLVLANRAILHYNAGRLSEALEDLNRAIVLSPENPEFYQNRAVALIALSRFEEATQDLATYLRLKPDADDRSEVERKLFALETDR